jgi:hypothetical protein
MKALAIILLYPHITLSVKYVKYIKTFIVWGYYSVNWDRTIVEEG